MRCLLIRVGIIAAIGDRRVPPADFLAGQRRQTSPSAIASTSPAPATETVEDVQHHPCTDPHNGEVDLRRRLRAGAETRTRPTRSSSTFIRDRCTAAFNTYTGLDFDTEQDLRHVGLHADAARAGPRATGRSSATRCSVDESPMTRRSRRRRSRQPRRRLARVSPTNGMRGGSSASTLIRSTAVFAVATSRT